jgi:hypothetical protein
MPPRSARSSAPLTPADRATALGAPNARRLLGCRAP